MLLVALPATAVGTADASGENDYFDVPARPARILRSPFGQLASAWSATAVRTSRLNPALACTAMPWATAHT